ncbi:hypothetical protein B0H21DRAFT_777789 [Amylocystis lapponica]|nr:hypothetical protein B0H21DRAFT_777789 [Amylocystis lapponica]
MSVDHIASKKRNTGDTVKRTSEDDHRRKRRNRTTQSCLNCHTSKRMCDRKRPCGRCTQLGLTGLCVYEVDDPSQSHESHDEKSRLQKRVAELESVIRELKNKPHPRWTNAGPQVTEGIERGHASPSDCTMGAVQDVPPSPTGSAASQPAFNDSYTSPSQQPSAPSQFLIVPDSNISSSLSPMNIQYPLSLSPLDTQLPSSIWEHPGSEPDYNPSTLFSSCQAQTVQMGSDSGFFDDIFGNFVGYDGDCNNNRIADHCGCLNDPASYNVVLELSLRLRKAAELLGQSSRHVSCPSTCILNQSIAELDRFATVALGNTSTPPHEVSPYSHHALPTLPFITPSCELSYNPSRSSDTQNSLFTMRSTDSSDGNIHPGYPTPPWNDPFMSWVPQ